MNTAIKYKTFQGGFTMIDNIFLDEHAAKVGPIAAIVYCYLSRSADQNTRVCKRLHATIAQKCGISEASVKRAIKKLSEYNPALIEVKAHRYERGNGCNEYRILPLFRSTGAAKLKLVEAKAHAHETEPRGQTERTQGSDRANPGVRQSEPRGHSDPALGSDGATYKDSGNLNTLVLKNQSNFPVGEYESIGEGKNPRMKPLLDELERQGVSIGSIPTTLALLAEWLKMNVTVPELAGAVEAVRRLPNCPRRITAGWVDTELRKRQRNGGTEVRRDGRLSAEESQSRLEWAQKYWEDSVKQKAAMDAKIREYAEQREREAGHAANP